MRRIIHRSDSAPQDNGYDGAIRTGSAYGELAMQLAIGKKSMALRIWPHRPHRPQSQQLRLPRADTANYLGASIEVVCRTLRDSWAKRLIFNDGPTHLERSQTVRGVRQAVRQ